MANNEDNEKQFKNWIIPDLDESQPEQEEDITLFGKPASWYRREEEVEVQEDAEDAPQPLTLDDIEAIRQSAYEDGFKEGKDNGFEQGLEEGKEQGLTQGLEEGTSQGLAQGLAAGQQQIQEQVTIWQSLIERLHNPLEKLDNNVEYQLIHLAVSLAEQIARCEVQTNPQIILQALKQAVDALPISEQTLKILLHPDDLKIVQTAYPEAICAKRGWDLQADPVLARGDCQIHTQASSIDYAFSNRIDQVLKHFFKENHQRFPEKNDDSSLQNDPPVAAQSSAEVEADSNVTEQQISEEHAPGNMAD